MPPRGVGFRSWPAGTAWSPTAGLSATEPICVPDFQAGTNEHIPPQPTIGRTDAGRDNGGVQRPVPSTIPDTPGSYQFKDAAGRVLYVGKAKSLRSRVMSYFSTGLSERTMQMVSTADSVEWIAVRNEVEALFLEFNLIKKHRPRFNIRLKDDKSYPYLAITLDEEWPRAMVMRGAKRKGVRYFGPYAHAYAIRETLDLLLRTFPIRTCTKNKFDRHARLGRPCLYAHIEKCVAPCVGAVSTDDYMALVAELIDFLDGDTAPILDRLDKQMHEASDELEFERAARLRDQILSVRKAIERQQMVDAKEEDYDAIGMVDDPLEASVQIFMVRKGRVVGRKGLVVDKVEDVGRAELVGRLLEQLYGDLEGSDIPREILVPDAPDDPDLYQEFLALQRGSQVRVRVPQRGAKRQLMETVTQNAHEAFARHKLKRATDHNARARALVALQDALSLAEAPLRIECYDISNLQGTEIVASMVVMEDGLPKRSDYRRFKIRHQPGQDDFASMEEVLSRRFRRYLQDRDEGARTRQALRVPSQPRADRRREGTTRRGRARARGDGPRGHRGGQPGQALRRGLRAGPGRSGPHPARLRGALPAAAGARRGAPLRHHVPPPAARQEDDHARCSTTCPVSGPTRKARLLKEHGSVKRLRALTEDDLVAIPWLPDKVARALFAQLHAAGRERDMTLDVTIITGMSGAGRSATADVLEDLGFFVIDNLPPALVAKVAELGRGTEGLQQFGLVIDVRSGEFVDDLIAALAELREMGASTRVLFLDAADDVLVRRYEASRRKHPLAVDDRVSEGITSERQLLEDLKGSADIVLDTTDLNVHELRDRLRELFDVDPRAGALQTSIVSFGYKHGLPIDVDLVFDCRFLPNPHWVDELRPLPGTDPQRPRLRARSTGDRPVPRRARASLRAAAPRLRARGQVVPVDRDRLHRRSPPQRGDRDRARPPARARRRVAPGAPPRRRPWLTAPPSSRWAAATVSPPRCARSAGTRVRSPRS